MSARSIRRTRERETRREQRRDTWRAKRIATAAGGLLAAAAVFAPAASAEPYIVNSLADPGDGTCDVAGTGDGCTLREAVRAANDHLNDPANTPDVITFAPNVVGEIQLDDLGFQGNDAIQITSDSLDIQGPGADKLTVIGSGNDRIFKLFGFGSTQLNYYDVTISGLTLDEGNTSGSDSNSNGGAILSTNAGFVLPDEYTLCGSYAALTLDGLHIKNSDTPNGSGAGVAVSFTSCGDRAERAAPATAAASLNVIDSTLNENDAGNDGGGIYMAPGTGSLFVSNSTIADNDADDVGGGIAIIDQFAGKVDVDVPDTFNVQNSTITGNDVGGIGGGIFSTADFGLRSTIVFGNTSTPPEQQPEVRETTASDLFSADSSTYSAGYSLIGTRDDATVTDVSGEPNLSADPQLGALQNNGGPTPTELPATTSPAIDTGISNSLSTDQRGLARTVDRAPANAADGTDIGAVEIPADPPEEPVIVPEPEPTPEPTPIPAPVVNLCFGKQVLLQKGGDAPETIPGTGVDDGIFGGGGEDTIDGFEGDDCLFGQVGDDLVQGGPGSDRANGDRDDDTVRGDDGSDDARGQNGDDRVFGGAGDDTRVTGGAGDDFVSGGDGADFLKGDGGNDEIDLGSGKDSVHAGGGADEIDAADGEKDKIICGTGKDVAVVDPIDDVDADCNTVRRG